MIGNLNLTRKYWVKLPLNQKLELKWRQAPPCSSWDTGRIVLGTNMLFSPGGIYFS